MNLEIVYAEPTDGIGWVVAALATFAVAAYVIRRDPRGGVGGLLVGGAVVGALLAAVPNLSLPGIAGSQILLRSAAVGAISLAGLVLAVAILRRASSGERPLSATGYAATATVSALGAAAVVTVVLVAVSDSITASR